MLNCHILSVCISLVDVVLGVPAGLNFADFFGLLFGLGDDHGVWITFVGDLSALPVRIVISRSRMGDSIKDPNRRTR